MFCTNCGAKNDDKAAFCESCGTPLKPAGHKETFSGNSDILTPEFTKQPPDRQKRKMALPVKIMIVEVIAIGILAFLSCQQLKKINDPETTVHNYMSAVMDQRWEEAYGYLYLPDSPFLTLEHFKNVAENSLSGVVNYKVKTQKENVETEEFVRDYRVEYLKKKNSEKVTEVYQAMKESGKQWLIYDKWGILPEKQLALDVKVSTYSSMTVKLDGITLDENTSMVENDGIYRVYTIPYLFAGTHTLEIAMDGFQPYSEDILIQDKNQTVRPEIPYMSEGTLKILSDQTCGYWQQFLEGILNNEKPSFVTEDLVSSYERSSWNYELGGYFSYYTDISLDNITVALKDYGYDGEIFFAEIQGDGIETNTSQLGRRSGYLSSVTYEGWSETGAGVFTARYHKIEGNWVLKEFNIDFTAR